MASIITRHFVTIKKTVLNNSNFPEHRCPPRNTPDPESVQRYPVIP